MWRENARTSWSEAREELGLEDDSIRRIREIADAVLREQPDLSYDDFAREVERRMSEKPGDEPSAIMEISPERQRQVREAAEQVRSEQPDILHRDFRKAVAERVGEGSQEESEGVRERIINRHISEIAIGNPGSSSCIEAPHGESPNPSEVARNFYETPALRAQLPERFAGASQTEILAFVAGRAGQLMWMLEKQGIRLGTLPDEWRGNFSDPLDVAIIDQLKTFEVNTPEIARQAADLAGTSSVKWRKSRMTGDPNAPKGESYIIDKDKGKKSLEYAGGSQRAGDLALEKIMAQTSEVGEDGKVAKVFVQLSLHRQFDKQDRTAIIIADGIKKGKTPCHPAIARLFQEILQGKIAQAGITYPDGRPLDISIAHEGMSLCGSSENVRRRMKYGDLFQCLQTEVKASLLSAYPTELSTIFGEAMQDLMAKFPDRESYENFISTEATEEEKAAENGVERRVPQKAVEREGDSIFQECKIRPPADVQPGRIACNGPCRRTLGVEPDQSVWVMTTTGWVELKVAKAKTSFAGNDKPSLSDDMAGRVSEARLEIRTTRPEGPPEQPEIQS